jgi:hypothetical protein
VERPGVLRGTLADSSAVIKPAFLNAVWGSPRRIDGGKAVGVEKLSMISRERKPEEDEKRLYQQRLIAPCC